jgi:DNA modification methylase
LHADQNLVPKNREYMAEPILDWILNGIPKPVDVKLFDDVGFIYEAQLAKMELSSWWGDLDEFRKRAAYYEEVNGQKTYHSYLSDVKGKGQIGHSNQYLTHWYYPYKAKFHPQMIKALINWEGLRRGQILLDPFAGSGTALIEAKLVGVDSIGLDIDPFCKFMSKVKCDLLDLEPEELETVDLESAFNYFKKFKGKSSHVGLSKFVEANNTAKSPLHGMDDRVHDFYLLSYLYALSDYTYVKREMWDGFQENISEIMKSLHRFKELKKSLQLDLAKAEVRDGDARFLLKEGIAGESIDGIVTSPPYSIAVDYIANDLHTFEYLGIEPEGLQDKLVGLKGKHEERVQTYFEDMEFAFRSMFDVLKSQGKCAVIIADVTFEGKKLPITQRFIEISERLGFKLVGVIRRPILGGFARLRYEYMILLQKP